jgi:hypothetical protein
MMANNQAPDVRVRLSAEGTAEVIAAFKRVQDESDKAKRSAGAGAGGINSLVNSLGGLKAIIPAISVAGIITGLTAMTKTALDTADGLGKLYQKTGITVETLSTLAFASRTADVEQETLAKSMIKFTRAMDDYDKGAKDARQATANLLGSTTALENMPMDERLLKIIDALGKLEPGAKRTGAAMAYFGKTGADLLPLVDDLANGGFEELRKKAQRLGLVIDTDLAAAAQRANDAITDMESIAQGMATQFTAGFAPEIASALETVAEAATGDGVDGFRKLGEFAGWVIKQLADGFIRLGLHIAFILGRVSSLAQRSYELIGNFLKGKFKAGWEQFKQDIIRDSSALDEVINTKFQNAQKALWGPSQEKPLKKLKRDKDESDNESLAKEMERLKEKQRKAALDLSEAQIDARAKLAGAELKQLEAEEKEKYEKGITSLEEYYQARMKLTLQQAREEEKALYDKIEKLQSAPLGKDEIRDERQAQIVRATAEYQSKVMENAATLKALESDRAKEMADLQQKALEFEKKIQKVQADRFSAARADIEAQAAALDDLLRKQGMAPDQRQQRVQAFRQAGNQEIDFSKLQDDGEKAIRNLGNEKLDINRQAQQGQLSEYERLQEISNLEAQRLPTLRQIAGLMAASAITDEQVQAAKDFQSKIEETAFNAEKQKGLQALQDLDKARQEIQRRVESGQTMTFQAEEEMRQLELERLPILWQIAAAMQASAITDEQRQAVADFQVQLQGLADSTNKAGMGMAAFKQDVQGALTSDLTNFLTSGIDQAENFGDAMRGLALSVVQSLRQIAAQMLATLLIQKMMGGLLGGAGGGAGGAGGGGGAVSVATGGLVLGPGSGTSDSIPARLSNYEHVTRAKIVKMPGVLSFLARLNSGDPSILGMVRGLDVTRGTVRRGGSRFADGGLVDARQGGSSMAGLTAVLGLDEGLLLKRIEASPEFSRVFVRTAQANQKAMKNAIGG